MIETTIPEINVAELMERVRAEAGRRRPLSSRLSSVATATAAVSLPPVALLPDAPSIWVPDPIKSNKPRLDSLLQTAREKTGIGSRIPKFLRRFFRKQGAFNRVVLDTMAALTKSNDVLTRRLGDISIIVGQFNNWLTAVHEQSDADANWMKAAAPVVSKVALLEAWVDLLVRELDTAGKTQASRPADQKLLAGKIEALAREQRRLAERLDLAEAATTGKLAGLSKAIEENSPLVRGLQDEIRAATENAQRIADTAANQARAELARIDEQVSSLDKRLVVAAAAAAESGTTLQKQLDQSQLEVRNLKQQTEALERQIGELKESLTKSTAERDQRTEQLRHQFDLGGEHLRNLQVQADRLGTHINNLQAFVDKHAAEGIAVDRGLEQRINDHVGLAKRVSVVEERALDDSAFIKGRLSEYGVLLRSLLKDGHDGAIPERAKTKQSSRAAHGLDSFYVSFENRFRGPRSEIKQRVAFYLPFLRQARAGLKDRPLLDVGCGRGEWLELLREEGLTAQGIDLNLAMVAISKEHKLDVRAGDAVAYLRSLRANSLGAVTGFHIIEHLPFEVLMDLFAQTRRVLKPGAIAIFESPNCKNLVVGACNFYVDPTHRNPIFPETAEFMLASHGFERIRIEYLSPVMERSLGDSQEFATLNQLLYGPQDFGVIAYKPEKK
jgi:O-antigen chain-terminating methyltransferase